MSGSRVQSTWSALVSDNGSGGRERRMVEECREGEYKEHDNPTWVFLLPCLGFLILIAGLVFALIKWGVKIF